MDKLFHVIIPTVKFEIMTEKFLKGLPSFANLNKYFSFGIRFQNYSDEQIEFVKSEFNKYGLDFRYTIQNYDFEYGKHKMQVIRNDCCLLNNECLYYLDMDDDIIYDNSLECTLTLCKCLIYLLENPKCGVLSLQKEHFTKNNFVFKSNIGKVFLSQGCFLRNIYNGQISPNEYLDIEGGLNEDMFQALMRLKDYDYYCAEIYFPYSKHYESKQKSEWGTNVYGWQKSFYNIDKGAYAEYRKMLNSTKKIANPSDYSFYINTNVCIDGNEIELLIDKLDRLIKEKY